MFRTACDNSVTTSQPASPPTANLRIPKCPPASPMCATPVRANPLHCPATARQRLIATHHDSPSIRHANPCGTGRVIPLRHCDSRIAARTISPRPPHNPYRHAHETSPRQLTTATNTASSSPMTAVCRTRQPSTEHKSALNLQPHPNSVVSTFQPCSSSPGSVLLPCFGDGTTGSARPAQRGVPGAETAFRDGQSRHDHLRKPLPRHLL